MALNGWSKMETKEHIITFEMLKELDALYEDHEVITGTMQVHRLLGVLVDELRKIRRLVEAGVVVKIEGTETVLKNWQDFYTWAHGRYYRLEDGYDKWIGDDS
jgi:hypothetical protein